MSPLSGASSTIPVSLFLPETKGAPFSILARSSSNSLLEDSNSIVVSPNPILRLYKSYVEREELIRRMNRIVPTIDVDLGNMPASINFKCFIYLSFSIILP